MPDFKIVDTNADKSSMRWLINVESANPLPVSVSVDFNLLDGCKADAFSSPNVPCDIDSGPGCYECVFKWEE
ncbi:MAG: hypothetical protein K2G17_06285 [Duncaniella sp.]|nr:hypothetical protein [Duncaniella sp.]